MTHGEMRAWGEALGRSLSPGDIVALRGDLGAGKTTLAQAIARGFGVADDVTSPTYALAHRYLGARGIMWHLDLYRIERATELANLGWDDIMAGDAAVLVEWPDRAGGELPAARVEVVLSLVPGDDQRRRLQAQ